MTAQNISAVRTADAAALAALPTDDPWQLCATGWTPPSADPVTWALCQPLFAHLLAAVVTARGASFKYGAVHRSNLANYLHWLASDNPEHLTVRIALSDSEIDRYLATEGGLRRRSHRSRVAVRSSLRSFRVGHPKVFRPSRRTGGAKDPVLPPVEDWEFDEALDQCDGFRNPLTRFHTRSILLLCRAAGLDGGDARWVRGEDIVRRSGAGLWVHVAHPTRTRDIPILARYATAIEDLASTRNDRCLIANVEAPATGETPGQLCQLINRSLTRGKSQGSVSPARLRKAWLVEQVAANTPLRTLLLAAGLRSLRTIDELVTEHGPAPAIKDSHLAWELGGVTRKGDSA